MSGAGEQESAGSGSAVPASGLPLSEMKQQFSLAYVRLVVAAAGCSVKSHSTDYDGVDITIASSADWETFWGPEFELQVKCTSQERVVREDVIAWQMDARPFRKLTNPKRFCPAYLGVLLVPGDPETWLDQDEARLITKSRMYWQRAAELGELRPDAATKTVHLPRSNLFDVAQLHGIMKSIGDGGDA
jgi:hypothetical protein